MISVQVLSRAQFIVITEIPLEAFKSLKRRGHIPVFADRAVSGEEDDSRNVYLGVEAVMLILANDLSKDGGLDREHGSRAVSILGSRPDELIDAIRRSEAREDIWMGVFSFTGGPDVRLPLVSTGTREELMAFIDNHQFYNKDKTLKDTYRITLASISRAVYQVHGNAGAVGLTFSSLISI